MYVCKRAKYVLVNAGLHRDRRLTHDEERREAVMTYHQVDKVSESVLNLCSPLKKNIKMEKKKKKMS